MSAGTSTANEILLAGCTSVPLACYLKGLGVLRIVSEQVDEDATGHWTDRNFVLTSRLDRQGLDHFLLHDYHPAPLVAPWNGGGGFYFREELIKDPKKGTNVRTGHRTKETTATRTLGVFAESRAKKFELLRRVISLSKETLAEMGLQEAPAGAKNRAIKLDLVRRLRSRLPNSLVDWLDVSVVLAADGVKFPPLLGSGGTDGNLDFTTNYMQWLLKLFDPATGGPKPRAVEYLQGCLYGDSIPGLSGGAIGQFFPGNAGGPNTSTGFEEHALVNPWDFVLMLEGVVLFAAATTRRLEQSTPGSMSFPFTVQALGAGAGGTAQSDESEACREMWLPVWTRPTRKEELRALLAEGRVTVHRRTARNGLDFVRAISGLGLDRGIAAFERYSFLQRLGRDMKLGVHLGRIPVRPNPQASLVDQLEREDYLNRLRRFARSAGAPGSVRRLVGLLEGSLFELARHGGRRRLQEVLMTLGEIQQVVGASRSARDAGVRPMPALSYQWVREADDGTDEFRVAAALAGLHADGMPMRCHLAPVDARDKPRRWAPESSLTVWGSGELVPNLVRVLERRLVEAERRDLHEKPFGGTPAADLAGVMAFLQGAAGRGRVDDRRIARLLAGLAFVRSPKLLAGRERPRSPVPAAFAVLKPLFVEASELQRSGFLERGTSLPLPGAVVASLAAGRPQRAVDLAWHRLRVAGFPLPRYPAGPPSAAGFSGSRLAAALMIPLNDRDLVRVLGCLRNNERRSEAASTAQPT